jgi:quercetin dioxygenase-like cupin family protein
MFYKKNRSGYSTPLKGVRQKTLVYGKHTLTTEFLLDRGSHLPLHSHPHEQTGYLVQGKLNMIIGDESFLAEPGDGWSIPGNVLHGADALEDSIAVEVFSPVRKEYLPENQQSMLSNSESSNQKSKGYKRGGNDENCC